MAPRQDKKRAPLACVSCRKRHVRCDGQIPCNNCKRRSTGANSPCVYKSVTPEENQAARARKGLTVGRSAHSNKSRPGASRTSSADSTASTCSSSSYGLNGENAQQEGRAQITQQAESAEDTFSSYRSYLPVLPYYSPTIWSGSSISPTSDDLDLYSDDSDALFTPEPSISYLTADHGSDSYESGSYFNMVTANSGLQLSFAPASYSSSTFPATNMSINGPVMQKTSYEAYWDP